MQYPVLDNIYDPRYLKYGDYRMITQQIYYPVRTIIEKVDKYTYYSDGRMEKETTHSLYPGESINGIPLLNSYGQMMFNFYMNKYKKPNNDNNSPIIYENL